MGLTGSIQNREMFSKKRAELCLKKPRYDHFVDTDSDNFYLSGYEAILLHKSQSTALKTVMSSTISFEDELLVMGDKECLEDLERNGKDLKISYYSLKTSEGKFDKNALNMELMLSAHAGISHVVYSMSDIEELNSVEKLISICQNAKVELIVNILFSEVDVIKEAMAAGVSYLVISDVLNKEKSLVIAKRSSLVKTEGISASFELDLHSYWQRGLDKRKSGIAPMMA